MVASSAGERLSFSKKNPNLQLAWDATSLQSLMTCPRRYQYEIVEGWRRGGTQKDLEFGVKFHESLEVYDHARARGDDKETALYEALDFALTVTGDHKHKCRDCGHEVASLDGLSSCPSCANDIGWDEVFVPWDTGDTKKNRRTLVRAVVWYVDEQKEEGGIQPYVFPDGTAAVELSFRIPLPHQSADGEDFILCGHLDGMATFGSEVFIRERKTTGKTISAAYFRNYAPNVQVDTYDLAGWLLFSSTKIKGVILEATQVGVSFARFQRQPFYHSQKHREEWLDDILDVLVRAEGYAKAGVWPMNRAVCNMYAGCPFRGVCAKAPSARDMFLRRSGDYVQHFWDPLETR